MLGENIKTLRKKKGYSQETMAQQLNIVRQTVSKWEKGISVPDADMLTKIADLFEVTVEDLLGDNNVKDKEVDANVNEIAAQLAVLNEQLANQNRRRRKTIKTVFIAIFIIFAITIAAYIAAFIAFGAYKDEIRVGGSTTTELCCTLNGEEYLYSITYDDQYQIISAGGDEFIADHVQTEEYDDANVLIARIEDYFTEHGGTCELIE